jgi:hypothetical protein
MPPAPRTRCSATTKNGEPCRSFAVHGRERCSSHLGLVGRETTLTSEITEQLVAMLRTGNYINVALRAVGVPRSTFTQWMRRGRGAGRANAEYRRFREQIDQAKAAGEVRAVASIATAARKNWQAAAWLLERQYPDRWGRTPMRMRDSPPPVEQPVAEPEPGTLDPFAEVDELAAVRARRSGA